MTNQKIYDMPFSKVYPMLYAKAQRKGYTSEAVDEITGWLTGYDANQIVSLLECDITYGDFFFRALQLNPNRKLIKGVICGVRVKNITEPLLQEIRYLDKLVDELVKGKSLVKIK